MGDATAHSGTNDLAIAYGDGATADSGYGSTPSGLSLVGQHDSAFADVLAAPPTPVAATATTPRPATVAPPSRVSLRGPVSRPPAAVTTPPPPAVWQTAHARGQSDNTATASDGGTADWGFFDEPGHLFNGGIGDSASANGTGSLADAGFGSHDLANVIGAHSTALAGGSNSITGGTAGSNDIAEALGNGLTANASTGSNLFAFEPTSFTAADGGDFGLTDVLHDLGLNGLAPGLESLLNLF